MILISKDNKIIISSDGKVLKDNKPINKGLSYYRPVSKSSIIIIK